MKRILLIIMVLVGITAQAQQTFNPTIRLLNVAENPSAEMVLVVNEVTKNIEWVKRSEISPDLSGYYTSSEVDLLLEDYYTSSETDALFLGYYTSAEVDAIIAEYYTKVEIDALLENISYNDLLNAPTNLSDFNNDEGFITISDVPSYTDGDGIDITNNEIRIKQSVLDEINANTNKTLSDVTSEGNVTNTKMKGSEVFSNTMKEDYAQIKNVNDSGWGLLPLQSEMKIALTAKDGTTVLSSIDVSWLASGDLAVSIDDTDPENPELVFSQGGVEVARIPANTLLSGVVRGGDLSGYKLQFKDGGNTVLFDIDLEDLFDNYYTITEADGRFALRSRSITGTGSLTGGGNLTANRTLDLSATTKTDIAKGVTAHGWGDFRDFGLGRILTSSNPSHKTDLNNYFNLGSSFSNFLNTEDNRPFDHGTLISLPISSSQTTQIAVPVQSINTSRSLAFRGSGINSMYPWRYVWDDFTLPNPATETWVNNQGFLKSNALNNYYTKTEADGFFALKEHTHATLTQGTGITAFSYNGSTARTVGILPAVMSDIALGKTAHGWGNHAGGGYFKFDSVLGNESIDSITTSGFYQQTTSNNASVANNYPNGAIAGMLRHYNYPTYKEQYYSNRTGRTWYRTFYSSWSDWEEFIHTGNLDSRATEFGFIKLADLSAYATETWVNSQGFLKSNALNNYYTKTESLNQFVGLSGVQSIADTKTFLASPVVPSPTLDAHAVNKGYVDDRVKFARYRWTNPDKFHGIINFPTEIFNYNLDTQRTNNNERIYVEEGYYNVNVTLNFEQNGQNFIEIYQNANRIASNAGRTDVGTTVSTGVIFIGANDYISVLVSTSENTENLITEISFEKIK